jgi:hypothetical protein
MTGEVMARLRHGVPAGARVPGAVPVLTGAVLFAEYCCVPETSHLPWVALVVAVTAGVELGERRPLPWVSGAVAVLVLGAGLYGGQFRDSAVVGALFAWWPFVVVVAASVVRRRWGVRRRSRRERRLDAVSAGVGVVAAVAVARTGALSTSVADAWLALAIAAPLSMAVVLAVALTVSRPGR